LADDNNDKKSQKVLTELEKIDDECDSHGVVFVKIENEDEAKEYGIEKIPALVYFEKMIPTMYPGAHIFLFVCAAKVEASHTHFGATD
jgi:hypothetical protein